MRILITAVTVLATFTLAEAKAEEQKTTIRQKGAGMAAAVQGRVLTQDGYLQRMGQHWDLLNKNKDDYLEWQGPVPKEPLSDGLKSCVIVKYELTPAVVNQKDPKNPGVVINEPAKMTPVDWLFFSEVFETMKSPTNECLSFDQTQTPHCIANKEKTLYSNWVETGAKGKAASLTGCFSASSAWGIPYKDCTVGGFAKWCAAKNGLYGVTYGEGHCTEYASHGAEMKESFLAAAAVAFAAEDHNRNAVIEPGEGRWLCQPWGPQRANR